jgi:hypothetical protein
MDVDQLDDNPRTEAEVMVVREKARATLRPLVAAFVADRYADVATDGVQVVALAQELLRQAGLILFAEDYPNVTMADTAACSVWFERACDALADAFEAYLAQPQPTLEPTP